MTFRVLGPLQVQLAGDELALGGAKQRAVLAVLLLRAGEVVSVERLVDEVWGDDPPPSAAHSLESYVSRLRQLFNGHGPRLVRRGAGYSLELDGATLDAREFADLQERASLAGAMDEHADVVGLTAAALALWRGPALADVALASTGRAEADRLEELRLRTYELRFDAELALGCHEQAIGELQKLVAQNSYREHFVAQLMLALYRCGRHAEALDVYERTRAALMSDLGLQPSMELQHLSGQIVRQDPQLRRPAPAARASEERPRGGRTRRVAELVLVGSLVAAVMALTASGSAPSPVAETASAPTATKRVALVLPKTNPDRHLNDILSRNVRASAAAWKTFDAEVLLADESDSGDVERVRGIVERGGFRYVLILGDGAAASGLASLARTMAETTFVFLDASLADLSLAGRANASAIRFADEQTSQLMGYLSALVTPRRDSAKARVDTVSIVAGTPTPHRARVIAGFRQGVKHARPDVAVRVGYTHDLVDPTECEQIANEQIDAGSDVVFVEAGQCGLGALAVARLRGVWGIGGYDDGVLPGPHVLAVTYKDWDRAIANVMADFELDIVLTGDDVVLGLEDNYAVGVDQGNLSPVVSESLWSQVVRRCSELRRRAVT